MRLICVCCAGLLALLSWSTVRATEPYTLGALTFKDCDLKNRTQGGLLGAQCAELVVAENPAAKEGRKITLRIGLLKAHNAQPLADPIFFIAGGPGQSAVESFPTVASGFARLLEKRHVILVDQRGTGESNPLRCEDESDALVAVDNANPQTQQDFIKRCLDGLRNKADPRFYTTTIAVQDLDRVRQALGVEQINLMGVSYGTRVAQVYLRQFPKQVRSIVLDGVVPPDLILGNEHAQNLEVAIAAMFQRCRDDQSCRDAFQDPLADLRRLQAELHLRSIAVDFHDPKSGEMLKEDLTLGDLGGVLRMFAYAPETAALLPLVLHEAANGRPEALLAQSRLVSGDLGEQITHAMQLAVICSEDADGFKARPEDADSIMGTDFVDVMSAQCADWPKGARPDNFHSLQSSSVPALLLSGQFDPVTPPRYGESTLTQFSKGQHLIAPGRGHSVLTAGCIPRLTAAFIEDLDAAALEVSCLDNLPIIPAFINRNGWTP